jgi:hypothetical protein
MAAVFLRRAQLEGWEIVRPEVESLSDRKRGRILSLRLPNLPEDLRQVEAVKAIDLGGFPWNEPEAIRNLLDALPPSKALAALEDLPNYWMQPENLPKLADRIPKEQVDEALSIAKAKGLNEPHPALLVLGLVHLAQGRVDDAVEIMQLPS